MSDYKKHIIAVSANGRDALKMLDGLPERESRALFVIDENEAVIGSITDGDIRRGLLNDKEIADPLSLFMNKNFKFLLETDIDLDKIAAFKNKDIFLVPILATDSKIIKLIDLRKSNTLIPTTALIMAGGRGERLRPLTDAMPKPMLKVGGKPIIERNVERLSQFGISDIYISIKYLGEQIQSHFGNGQDKGLNISYITEEMPLGTLGAMGLIDSIAHDSILVMNSDLLTNIDFEDFYRFFLDTKADMCIASIPYQVKVPYAVLETDEHAITSFSEKPTYTYYSNGGIYFIRSEYKKYVTKGVFYNATDLMEVLIKEGKRVTHYPMLGYWLDIGRHEDYAKAQEDIKHIKF